MAIVPFQSFVDSSHRSIVDRLVQCTQSPVHLAESATASDSSWLQWTSEAEIILTSATNWTNLQNLQKQYH